MEEEKKIYIGNLDYGLTKEEIRSFMEEKGVEATDLKLITDKMTGKSKGFGFAEFEKEEDAHEAIESLDGQELKGRKLRVNKARRQRSRFNRSDRFKK
ncbi:RNA-binding protein [bacterium]|nr:RNA-binding protein [bacterium]